MATRWLTVQEVDAAARARRKAARAGLPTALAERSRGRPWRYVVFGSLARGDFHPWSDADIVVIDAGEDWPEAERAAHGAAEAFGVEADVSFWEELSERVRAEVLRYGIACAG
jgi:predicted nucleotidyltransferase